MTQQLTRDVEEMSWLCAPQRGVSYKSLRYDPETGAGAVLIHMTPGTTYPTHRLHAGLDVYVLDGDLAIAGTTLQRGAYAWLASGVTQTPMTTEGCVLFATFAGRVENIHE